MTDTAEMPAAEQEHEQVSMQLNMGPQHPSTHGVLRLILELDGEEVLSCDPVVGYLHRSKEKIAENLTWHQFIPYTDRLDYLAPLANNVSYACAVEKLCGLEIPERARVIRVMCNELARISAHLLGLGAFAMDIGAMTVFLWTFTQREVLYNVIEAVCGARFTTSYTRIGGLADDVGPEFLGRLRDFVDTFPDTIDDVDRMLTRNRIWLDRTVDVGVITREQALSAGLTGPCLRGSGVSYDVRRAFPYLDYDAYEFDVPVGTTGDCYDRYLCRIEEMRQSVTILRQALDRLPDGPVNAGAPKTVLPEKDGVMTGMEELIHMFMVATGEALDVPDGEVYFGAENPKGELGFLIKSTRGATSPDRLHIRGPSFANLAILAEISPGHMVSDMIAILGSIDFVMGECDR